MSYQKLEKDGKIAVVYSPGFGAGWSSWNGSGVLAERMCMDAEIAQAVLDGDFDRALFVVEEIGRELRQESVCMLADELAVQWVDKGTRFEISEYDGAESVRVFDTMPGFVA